VKDKVMEIEIEDVLIGSLSFTYFINRYLLIADVHAPDKIVHVFDKKNFSYITSTGDRGAGPNEITNFGAIGVNEADRIFYVSDFGKQRIYGFSLDSVLINPHYIPIEHIKMDTNQYPLNYLYINDTLSIGLFMLPISVSDYIPAVGKWNMRTGEIQLMNQNDHPQIDKKRTVFAASAEYGLFVECYRHHDLMVICDLDGNLKYNIYGQKWDNRRQNSINFYAGVSFCNDKIIALYFDGENNFATDVKGAITGANYSSKLIVFNIQGDYIKTLETGYRIQSFSFDRDNNRIIMVLDDEIQFAYLELDGLI
jgi:hypothetical protein